VTDASKYYARATWLGTRPLSAWVLTRVKRKIVTLTLGDGAKLFCQWERQPEIMYKRGSSSTFSQWCGWNRQETRSYLNVCLFFFKKVRYAVQNNQHIRNKWRDLAQLLRRVQEMDSFVDELRDGMRAFMCQCIVAVVKHIAEYDHE